MGKFFHRNFFKKHKEVKVYALESILISNLFGSVCSRKVIVFYYTERGVSPESYVSV